MTVMDATAFLDAAHHRCSELPGSALTRPFGPGWDVYKVRGKVFALFTEAPGRPMVILKADPFDAELLRGSHREITPGYHMNKRHWISVEPGPGVDAALVTDLITDSYLLVVEKLPRRDRPVDPATFGRA